MSGSDDSARVDIYMRVYVSDYLSDTSDLSAEEFGAYTRLLFEAWKRGGELPREPHRLARLATVEPDAWTRVWAVIGRFFSLTSSGALTQKRLSAELAAARERKARASLGGIAKAERRQGCFSNPPHPTRSHLRLLVSLLSGLQERLQGNLLVQGFRDPKIQRLKWFRDPMAHYPENRARMRARWMRSWRRGRRSTARNTW